MNDFSRFQPLTQVAENITPERYAVSTLDNTMAPRMYDLPLPRGQMAIKRGIDIIVSLTLLLLLSPVFLLCALAVRLSSRGPVIYQQQRVGYHHRLFTIFKFRTMYVRDVAEGVGPLAAVSPKRRGDPRITPLGAFLRRTSLDELPQLLNVLAGDMSLVGPRPELPSIVAGYALWQYERLAVPQGMTGWWQVHGRGERLLHLHTEDDVYYVRHFSLLLDLKILLMTCKVVVTGHGAF